jgi:ATP-dependent protease ClpP protease subunit
MSSTTRHIYAKLDGKIERDCGANVVVQLKQLAPDKHYHLHLLIDSNGGDIPSGQALYAYLRTPKSHLTVYGGQKLRSVAPAFFIAATDRRLSAQTEVCIHCARRSITLIASTPRQDLDEAVESLQRDDEWMLSVLRERGVLLTGEEQDQFRNGKNLAFAAPLAVERGFAPRIGEFPSNVDITVIKLTPATPPPKSST